MLDGVVNYEFFFLIDDDQKNRVIKEYMHLIK